MTLEDKINKVIQEYKLDSEQLYNTPSRGKPIKKWRGGSDMTPWSIWIMSRNTSYKMPVNRIIGFLKVDVLIKEGSITECNEIDGYVKYTKQFFHKKKSLKKQWTAAYDYYTNHMPR